MARSTRSAKEFSALDNPLSLFAERLLTDTLKKITPFDGNPQDAASRLLTFIRSINMMQTLHPDLTEEDLFLVATCNLRDHAFTWLDDWNRSVGKTDSITRWTDLRRALRQRFIPAACLDSQRLALQNLTQTGTVGEYNAAFEKIRLTLPNLESDAACLTYICGLKPSVRDRIRNRIAADNLTLSRARTLILCPNAIDCECGSMHSKTVHWI